ncbi:uncharacterized protein EI97DRAFT_44792 [Westerdykella ornata]|uniref:DUF3176 domain containing protein n=1 Tax=Westerdykella ornata TaxID=318751 RepID=A0A6A6JKE5_WESOR|nr:uncharacterized protein EI97DRAFT_44792 [Westerdykella ornata]KAF2276583.1 hypothetical protein EI97DRAFT_44792 [Westerdykella ornata]
MSKNKALPPWPQYPNIPIYLDTPDGRSEPVSFRGSTGEIYQAPEISTAGRSPRYIVLESPLRTPSTLEVPTPIQLSPQSPQQPRRPPLRYFLDKKAPAQRRSKRHSRRPSPRYLAPEEFPTIHRRDEGLFGHERKSSLGLGISDISSDTTLTPESPVTEREEPNFAQRLEKRIWRYNTSGNVLKRWLLEIISWLISAICMGAIVGVLIYLKDQRLPRWPYGLTLNAYIAVVSRVASAALLLPTTEALGQLKWSWFLGDSKQMWDFEIFDNASRGPWGAILLLIRTKGRSLAALGALVMLLSLVLDPFFQQVVDFPERWTLDGWNSTIPTVVNYNPPFEALSSNGNKLADKDLDIQFVAEKFLFGNGTQPVPFGNGTRAEIPLSCPTSNCTWPQYETLALCSSCVEIKDMLTFACLNSRIDWIANLTGASTEDTYPNATSCGYFLNATSDRPVLMSGYLLEDVDSVAGRAPAGHALIGRALPLVTHPEKRPIFGGSVRFKHIRNTILDVLIAGSVDAAGVYRNETPLFQECVLSFCVKTLKSSYHWASYREEVVATYLNTTEGPFPWRTRKRLGADGVNGTVVSYIENITIQAPSSRNNGQNTFYGLSNMTTIRTVSLFHGSFPFFTTADNATTRPVTRFRTFLKDALTAQLEFNPWLPPNNVTQHLNRLAAALTDAIRSSDSKEMLEGMTFSTEIYVSVRWVWLVLPLGLLLMSFIFLLSTIIKASIESERVGVWKTSAIATLLYGLPDDLQQKIKSSAVKGTPRTKAKELRVKKLSKGWRASGLFSPLTPKVRQDRPPPGWI